MRVQPDPVTTASPAVTSKPPVQLTVDADIADALAMIATHQSVSARDLVNQVLREFAFAELHAITGKVLGVTPEPVAEADTTVAPLCGGWFPVNSTVRWYTNHALHKIAEVEHRSKESVIRYALDEYAEARKDFVLGYRAASPMKEES